MLKFITLSITAVLLTGCYEETVVERRNYRPRHHVTYVADRPYRDRYYYRGPGYYRDGYYDDGPYYEQRPVRRRVILGF